MVVTKDGTNLQKNVIFASYNIINKYNKRILY